MLAICALALTQIRVGGVTNFKGFVPDAETAVAVGRPILKRLLGDAYLKASEPFVAKSVLGRWVVTGTYPVRAGEDRNVEPYVMAIDPWSARVVVFGPAHLTNVQKELKRIPPDRPTK